MSAPQHLSAKAAPFRPTRLFWAGAALEVVGIMLAVWGKLALSAFVERENAAGRDHGVTKLFQLTSGWLAAFWIGLVMALAGSAIVVVCVFRARRDREAAARG